ncbi:unnamed protein product [Cuscuta epithymum]|uniref:WRKY domain-containing protein n=1 Tax=Cuscuta epithymum TaxID=186058 RepID=A0AAV0E9P6_9ASTE|nr:unnamed protein product [Cuscuta epithymum]
MGESSEGVSAVSGHSRLALTVPPRPPTETLFSVGPAPGFSPAGPTTLKSSFCSDSHGCSFSQLLAGAMASPLAKQSLLAHSPLNPPVANSPSFMVSPRFSPSGSVNSPVFVSPLQSPLGMSHQQALAYVTAQASYNLYYKQMQAAYDQHLNGETPDTKLKSIAFEKPASDGYNWRKYGQKFVKGSECPRSYYRCTRLDCAVKKKIERSSDGRIVETTYKGEHNHELPKPNKRKQDECKSDELEMSTKQLIVACKSHEMEETTTVLDEEDDVEPNTETKCLEVGSSVQPPFHKTVTEPKIVLQRRSVVDHLDDGYKWRKYGQKVVKGNANPRSYYRCTYMGCNVRKHVERASADPIAVVTTYEGQHNHDMPTAYSAKQE